MKKEELEKLEELEKEYYLKEEKAERRARCVSVIFAASSLVFVVIGIVNSN